MFAFGIVHNNLIDGYGIPMPWSTKMNKATINSIKIKMKVWNGKTNDFE
jgi:hypothetical protein